MIEIAYKSRVLWLIGFLENFKSTIKARNTPISDELLIKVTISFFKSSTVHLNSQIREQDINKGRLYIEERQDLSLLTKASDVNVSDFTITKANLNNDSMVDILNKNFIDFTSMADDKNFIKLEKIFDKELDKTEILNRAMYMSYLTFQDLLAYSGKGFVIKGKEHESKN